MSTDISDVWGDDFMSHGMAPQTPSTDMQPSTTSARKVIASSSVDKDMLVLENEQKARYDELSSICISIEDFIKEKDDRLRADVFTAATVALVALALVLSYIDRLRSQIQILERKVSQ